MGPDTETETETETETGGDDEAWNEPPSCDGLELPGTAAELASTPRPNRSAELLALSTDASALVAPDEAYAVIAADLEAIVELDPSLEDITPECSERGRLQFWWEDSPLPDVIWRGEYRAWECHNEWFGVSTTYRLDGKAYGLELDKVVGSALVDAYQTLPGFEDADVSQCWYREGLCDPDCEQTAFRNIELQVFSGASSAREYRFVRRTEENPVDVRYRVEPGQAPQVVP